VNTKVYIHELITITGHNRARYMHHMTANWSPVAQEERGQLCYGVWGVVGSTGSWPQVVNIWEEDGWEGLGRSFRHELSHADLQDPKLARWWAAASSMRSGGVDRILVPAPWTQTIEGLCLTKAIGVVYAHDHVIVAPGEAGAYLDMARQEAGTFFGRFGWHLIGAWETALAHDSEAFLLWSIPSWEQWAAGEQCLRNDTDGIVWRDRNRAATQDFHRILLVDAPLSPLRMGRQPARSDRDAEWVD
jgi:hypothetical protein